MSTPVVNAVTRAIRRATKQSDVVAAVIVSTVVRRSKYPREIELLRANCFPPDSEDSTKVVI